MPRSARRRRRRGIRLLRRLLYFLAVVASLPAVGLLYLRFLPPLLTTVQIQRVIESWWQGRPVARVIDFESLDAISNHLEHAVVAAEDTRFFEHSGVDWVELETSARGDRHHPPFWRGASTITQQLVKNLFLTTHRSVLRKVAEIPLAWMAELILPKRRILELYLNVIEWGPGIYGAETAAQFHYGVPAVVLTRDQAARLAACIPSPLHRRPQAMGKYAEIIKQRMTKMDW